MAAVDDQVGLVILLGRYCMDLPKQLTTERAGDYLANFEDADTSKGWIVRRDSVCVP